MNRLTVALTTILLAGLLGCSSDSSTNPDETQADFQLSVSELMFSGDTTASFFTIQSTSGDTLAWSITEFVSWLTVSPAQGSTSTDTDTVYVTVDHTGLSPGEYSGSLKVISQSGGERSVSIQLQVPVTPDLFVDPSMLDFPAGINGAYVTIQNIGGDTLNWSLSSQASWLVMNPASGSTTSEIDSVIVYVTRGVLHSGFYVDTLFVSTTDGQRDTIRVTMEVPQELPYRITYWNNAVVEEDHYKYDGPNSIDYDSRPKVHLELTDWPGDYGLEMFVLDSNNFSRYINGQSFDVYWHQSVYSTGSYDFTGNIIIPHGRIVYVVVDNTDYGWDDTDFDFSNDRAYFDFTVDLQPE